MDVLRVAGVPGVGKSAVAWDVARELVSEGMSVGYVDIDQLGMCYPEPVGDVDRWMLKEHALARVAEQFRRDGVARLIVSGVADPAAPPPRGIPRTSAVWLDADEGTRSVRLAPRGWTRERVEAVLAAGSAEAAAVHRDWLRLETTDHPLNETVGLVRARWESVIGGAACDPSNVDDRQDPAGIVADAARLIWLTGPRCAGASQVGWQVVDGLWRGGHRAGFVDVAQLGFVWRAANRPVREEEEGIALRNAAAVHEVFSRTGAHTLIAVAPFEMSPDAVRHAFPEAELSFFRLDADDATRRTRALERAAGEGGPVLAGDDLRGAPPSVIDEVVRDGARQRRTPVRVGEHLLDATGGDPAELAAVVRRACRLPD